MWSGQCSLGSFENKEEELELNWGLEARCGYLQSRVDQSQGQLTENQFEMDGLRGDVADRKQRLEEMRPNGD